MLAKRIAKERGLLHVNELRDKLGWGAGKLNNWLYSSKIPVVKVGNLRFVTQEVFDKCLAASTSAV